MGASAGHSQYDHVGGSNPMRERSSTLDSIESGVFRQSGNQFRLRTHSDFQEAIVWMEGRVPEPDQRHLLPLLLMSYLVFGGAYMIIAAVWVFAECGSPATAITFAVVLAVLHVGAILMMTYVACSDPGQLEYPVQKDPLRSHKTWQYDLPVRRYDHYCRWVTNSIGLMNHRAFFIMLVFLVTLAVLNSLLGIVLILASLVKQLWFFAILGIGHLTGSLVFGYYVLPIFRLHIGFISRNELAYEWKEDLFYVVKDVKTGKPVWVGDLDAETFSEKYDDFLYDKTRNKWDRGCNDNCYAFWCTSRHDDQMGEF
mmetsp:Transcript_70060/g.130962  ORF Transcript_70060/g.130962 Transcript_70060/m.130962 type:complete len:312 (-) Transcript_70060:223-1158(-)